MKRKLKHPRRMAIGAATVLLALAPVLTPASSGATTSGWNVQVTPERTAAGEVVALVATVHSAPAGHPHQLVQLLAEIEGGSADIDGNTPDYPDMSCYVLIGSSCAMPWPHLAGAAGGLVRVWAEYDGNRLNGLEADFGEALYAGPGDDGSRAGNGVAGKTAEPDNTDVVELGDTNAAPVAAADTASTLRGSEVVVGVLANDADGDGDTLAVRSTTEPADGTAVVRGDGSVVYRPRPGFHGTDSFTYLVSDPAGASAVGTVTVTVPKY